MHNIMDELNENGGEKLNDLQGLAVERLTSARWEAKPAPDVMSIEMLMTECIREISSSPCGDSSSDEYCMEVLHRAIMCDDQEAREIWQQCLRETVRGWLDSHPKREVACRLDSEEKYIAQAFARFHQAAILQQVEFSRLSSALQYLRVSLNSVLLDTLRASSRPLVTLLPKRKPCHSDMSTAESEVWEMLERILLDIREQRLAFLLFNCGLRPKDIVHTFPEEFHDAREISLLQSAIIGRLLDLVDQHN